MTVPPRPSDESGLGRYQRGEGRSLEPPGGYGVDLPPGLGLQGYRQRLPERSESTATLSLVLGVASLAGALVCLGWPLGVAAIVTGTMGVAGSGRGTRARTLATAGIVTGVLGSVGGWGLYFFAAVFDLTP